MLAVQEVFSATDPAPTSWIVFLHGILGSGGNLRTLAKKVLEKRVGVGAILVDLRLHGRSLGLAPPHTVSSAAKDVEEACAGRTIVGIVGHSFGGKVALAWAAARGGNVDDVWLLDSMPGPRRDHHGSEETIRVLDALQKMPPTFPTREGFATYLRGEGFSEPLIQWLSMNIERTPEDLFRFKLDLSGIRELLFDYFERDDWPTIESPPGRVRIHIIIGGASTVFLQEERTRAMNAARSPRITTTVIEGASHWIHVDEPDKLASEIASV